jgi:hypothetical protein
MVIEYNPATKAVHEDCEARIKLKFKDVDFSTSSNYLCLADYINKTPQKFYSKEAFDSYTAFLNSVKEKDPILLAEILREFEPFLNISNRVLSEVNEKAIHDVFLPSDNNDLINFIDKNVHYNLLKIYETPFYCLSKIIAKYYWIKSNKKIDGLDLYHSVEQLKKIGFSFVDKFYLHNVRNGIAHGKILFTDKNITYIDKKDGEVTIPTRKIIDTLDGIIDITNGFFLAFKIFVATNTNYLINHEIQIPQSVLLEELQAKANGPAWKILNCLESNSIIDKKQLVIYVKNDNWDYGKVLWYSFTTAMWAEAITKSYDRIFLSLTSKNSSVSPVGWAAYDAVKFRNAREKNEKNFEALNGVLEGNYVFFTPKYKFPKLVYRIGTLKSIIQNTFPLDWEKYTETYFPNPFIVRETQIHSKKSFAVVQDTSIIVKSNFQSDIENLIRVNRKRIIKLAISYSRKQCSIFSITRYLPVKYARVFIYDTDKRLRNLRNSGLIPELVATIEINTSKRIQTIDIFGGKPEQIENFRIVWNMNWHRR